jgi:ApaG protein
VLDPGAVHRYTSGAILKTPIGSMEGTYEMHEVGGRIFQARIPRFRLHRPGVLQ